MEDQPIEQKIDETILKTPQPFFKNIAYMIPVIIVILIIIASLGFWYYQNQTPKIYPVKQPPKTTEVKIDQKLANSLQNKKPDDVIMKVGEENIYKKDLETELAAFPKETATDSNKYLLDKMAEDSVILQGANKDGLIKLDNTTFNSPSKDYIKRIKLIESAKQAIGKQTNTLSGSIISIWFFNIKPGTLGYEKGKEFALQKITQIRNDIKSGKLTFAQAIEQIRKDTSLTQVDEAYQANAGFNFTAKPGDAITIDQSFDEALWKLNKGEISEIFLSKDYDQNTKQKIDAFYTFGVVTDKIGTGKITNFQDWLNKQNKLYEIKIY